MQGLGIKDINLFDFRAPGKQVYLDHSASTPIHGYIRENLSQFLENWGNPSSIHQSGRGPKAVIREARRSLAGILGVSPLELIFTSGGSEANNSVFHSLFGGQRNTYLVSSIEHPSVMAQAKYLEKQGAKVKYIPVNRDGMLDLDFIQANLSEDVALVSVMLANNEIGSIFPVKEIARMAKIVGALVHSDCVQAFGKMPLDLKDLGVDFASISGHKFYSLKGCGLLYCKKNIDLKPLIYGGGQERYRRGGTENPLAIQALGFMSQFAKHIDSMSKYVGDLRDVFEVRVKEEITDIHITAAKSPRLANNSSLVLEGVDGESLLMNLDLEGFSVSTGAACSSGNPEPSPVLRAIGLSLEEAQSSLRVSFGWGNTKEDVEAFVSSLKRVVERIRKVRQEYA